MRPLEGPEHIRRRLCWISHGSVDYARLCAAVQSHGSGCFPLLEYQVQVFRVDVLRYLCMEMKERVVFVDEIRLRFRVIISRFDCSEYRVWS
jgi:hypothetical protein